MTEKKQSLSFLLFVLLFALSICLTSIDVYAHENLVPNSSFASDVDVFDGNASRIVSNWTTVSGAGIDVSDGRNDTRSMNVIYSSPLYGQAVEYPTVYVDITTEAYTDYEWTFYVKMWDEGSNITKPLYYGIRNPNGANPWETEGTLYTLQGASFDWQKITCLFNSGALTTVRLAFYSVSHKNDKFAGYRLDDVACVKKNYEQWNDVVPVSDVVEGNNLLVNSSFEMQTIVATSNPKALSNVWTSVSAAGTLREQPSVTAYSGSSNAFLAYSKEGLNVGEYPTLYQDVNLQPHTVYELSFFVKKYGDAVDTSLLHFGYRDPNGNDIWTHVGERVESDITQDYRKITYFFDTKELSTIRVAFFTAALDYGTQQGEGGYYLDDVRLFAVSEPQKASFKINKNFEIGKPIPFSIFVDFANGKKNVPVQLDENVRVRFVSDNVLVADGDLKGNLIAKSKGSANVTLYVDCFNKTLITDSVKIDVTDDNVGDEVCIVRVDARLQEEISLSSYAQLGITAMLSDGTFAKLGGYDISVESSDSAIVCVRQINSMFYLLGISNGTARIYVTVKDQDRVNFGFIDVTVQSENLLIDGSFEQQKNLKKWKVETNCGTDVDDGLNNKLARSGYANMWMAAPVAWDTSVANDSAVRIWQKVSLDKGIYELSGYINRFFATSIEGTLSACGGIVTIGVVRLDNAGTETDDVQSASFDTTYGFGGYQKIFAVIDVQDGEYLVFVSVKGDKQYGLGMQLDDMSLRKAVYPKAISAKVDENNQMKIDDISKVKVFAILETGSTLVEENVRIIVQDYNVAYVSNGFLIGRNSGTTEVRVVTTILGKEYQTTFNVTVSADDAPQKNTSAPIWIAVGATVLLILVAAVATIVLRRKKHG